METARAILWFGYGRDGNDFGEVGEVNLNIPIKAQIN